jgi:hypothetical protein
MQWTLGSTMWRKFSYHLIGEDRLLALRSRHSVLLLLLVAAQRNNTCSLVGSRRADLLCHAGSDRGYEQSAQLKALPSL